MTCCSNQILKKIKVVASLGDATINNALTYENGVLQFRGALVQNTEVWGNYTLNFGTTASKLNQFNVQAGSVSLESNNGSVENSIRLTSTGAVLTSTTANSKGLEGAIDFSANYTLLSFIQRGYADTKIVSRSISAILADPQPAQDGFAITWDDTNQVWTLTTPGSITAGTDTQIIYNNSGSLVGNANFLMLYASNTMSVPQIMLGHAALAGTDRTIYSESSSPNVNLHIRTKGTGSLILSFLEGKLLLGDANSANTNHIITAQGAQTQIDISLEPKSTGGKVYIGSEAEAGAYRYIKARGNAANVSLVLQSKGTVADLILDPNSDATGLAGTVKIGTGVAGVPGTSTKRLHANSDFTTTHLELGGDGAISRLYVGLSSQAISTRYLTVGTASADCNFKISAKGTGVTYIDGKASKKVTIGDWNMDSTDTVTVNVGVSPDFYKILAAFVVIISDDGVLRTQLDWKGNGGVSWNSGVFYLDRLAGGIFDNANYNATGFNRGHIYVVYEE
jgi:hypothetical protein